MDATLSTLNAALSGRYAVEREIGAGGMATVYLANDVRHHRRVALKLLKPEIAAVLGVDRFLSEIRVTANLQHPHLLPLFDSGEAENMLFYVMPFVEGETLRQKIDREKQLRVDDALQIAIAVADALEYAHSNGVIHRDLKPENILLQAGHPLVTDFGIALAVSNAGGARITQTGLSLGTPQYMSPEQATGDRAIDGRTDIYSLAAVLYEMLTGEPPHVGPTVQAVIARVVTDTAQDVRVLRPTVPEHVALAIATALAKLPADRWATARDFALALEGGMARAAAPTPSVAARSVRHSKLRDPVSIALAAALLVAAGAAYVEHRRVAGSEAPEVRYAIDVRGDEAPVTLGGSLALSPDGTSLVFVAGAPGKRHLTLRRASQLAGQPIAGTEGALSPFFSPDGKWIGFMRAGKMWKMAVEGGPAVELAELPQGIARGNWTRNGEIIFSSMGHIWSVAAAGGTPREISRPDTLHGERARGLSVVAADGKTIVYASVPTKAAAGNVPLVATTVDGAAPTRLGVDGTAPIGFIGDILLYSRTDGVVMGLLIDLRHRRGASAPIALIDGVTLRGAMAVAAVSQGGALVYSVGGRDMEVSVVDEHGAVRPLLPDKRPYDLPRLSPDGKRLAIIVTHGRAGAELWTYEFATSTMSRVNADTTVYYEEWSPDSRSLLFTSGQAVDSTSAIMRQPVDGSAPPSSVLADKHFHYYAISPDGRTLVYSVFDKTGPGATGVLWTRQLNGDPAPHRLTGFPGGEWGFRFSPDGKWMAYLSDESGSDQVYVRPFPGPGPRVQISAKGGTEPVWSPDGKRLFYRKNTEFYAASLAFSSGLTVSARTKLFEGPFDDEWDVADYDVTRDGKQLVVVRPSDDDRKVIVVLNFAKEIRERFGAGK